MFLWKFFACGWLPWVVSELNGSGGAWMIGSLTFPFEQHTLGIPLLGFAMWANLGRGTKRTVVLHGGVICEHNI